MSTQVTKDDKISILQNVIRESIHSARLGQNLPVKLASQRLFQLTQSSPRLQGNRSEHFEATSQTNQEEIFEIQQKMYIA
jgi:hypothetical protein